MERAQNRLDFLSMGCGESKPEEEPETVQGMGDLDLVEVAVRPLQLFRDFGRRL